MRSVIQCLMLVVVSLIAAIPALCDKANGYYARALSELSKNDMKDAIGDATKAIEHRPEFADAYLLRAMAEQSMGETDKAALDDITKAIQLKPDQPRVYIARGRVKAETHNPKGCH